MLSHPNIFSKGKNTTHTSPCPSLVILLVAFMGSDWGYPNRLGSPSIETAIKIYLTYQSDWCLLLPVDGSTFNKKITMITIENFNEYSVGVSESPEYYGNVTPDRAANIADDITQLIEHEFTGIVVRRDESPVRGPNEETCYRINSWIQANWQAAL